MKAQRQRINFVDQKVKQKIWLLSFKEQRLTFALALMIFWSGTHLGSHQNQVLYSYRVSTRFFNESLNRFTAPEVITVSPQSVAKEVSKNEQKDDSIAQVTPPLKVNIPYVIGYQPEAQASIATSNTSSASNPSPLLALEQFKGVEAVREESDHSLEVTLSTDAFFESGTAVLGEKHQSTLSELVSALKNNVSAFAQNMLVEIEAHTDDTPVIKQRKLYHSNWELSAARASSLVHVFENAGFTKEMLKVVGYGDSRPLLPNRSPSGEPITENLSKNRRIVLRVYSNPSSP